MTCYVFKRRGAKYYSAKLRMEWETKISIVALRTPDKRIAEMELQEIVKERYLEHRGMLAPSGVREAAGMPLNVVLEGYLSDLTGRGRSKGTVDKYRSNISTVIHDTGWRKLPDVTALSFTEWRAQSLLAPKGLNDKTASLRGFLKWLCDQHRLERNPLDAVGRVDTRLVKRYRRALSPAEQQKLLATAPHFRAVIYLFILETGIRRKELHSLKCGDFALDMPKPSVLLPASITKNREPALIRLRPHVVTALRSIMPDHPLPSEWVFHNRVPRIETFKRDLAKAAIPFETEQGRVDLHALRDTLCTNLMRENVHPRVAQELMRHSTVELTMKVYTDPSQLPLAEAQAKLPVFTLPEKCTQKCTQICTQTGVSGSLEASHVDTAGQTEELLQCL